MLVDSMNPFPCGFFGYEEACSCTCIPQQVQRYRSKISGPLLDRIDIHIVVPRVDFKILSTSRTGEKSETIRMRVNQARLIQSERFKDSKSLCNSSMTPAEIKKYFKRDALCRELLRQAFDSLGLSARALDRILKVARTIVDLAGEEKIQMEHIADAIQYRSLDRKFWV